MFLKDLNKEALELANILVYIRKKATFSMSHLNIYLLEWSEKNPNQINMRLPAGRRENDTDHVVIICRLISQNVLKVYEIIRLHL